MIADPMANLGGPPGGAGGGPPGAGANAAAGSSNTKEVIDIPIMQMNLQRIDRIRSVMGIVAGCVAGILGLTGLQGFCKHLFLFVMLIILFRVIALFLRHNNVSLPKLTD